MKSNYMMDAEDVANELGISKGHAYKVIRRLNEELEKSGFIIVAGESSQSILGKEVLRLSNSADSIRRENRCRHIRMKKGILG